MTKNAMRHPASQALIDLRTAMGLTQQRFAVEVLDCAIGTVSRYESFGPPRGEALLTLRNVALKHNLLGLAEQFRKLWLEEIHALLGDDARTILVAEGNKRGLLVASLTSPLAVELAWDFLALLGFLASKDPKFNKHGIFKEIQKATRKGKSKLSLDIEDVFIRPLK